MSTFVDETDEIAIKRERHKAQALRQTQWWKRQLARGRCHYCGRDFAPQALTMDHIVPLARGGKSKKGNVVTACKDCNTKKKTMLPMEWDVYIDFIRSSDG